MKILSMLLMCCLLTLVGQCSIAGPKNSFGAVISIENPNAYVFGLTRNAVFHDCDRDEPCTTVEVAGWATPLLQPSPILTFCGDQSQAIYEALTKSPWTVYTYRRNATRIYNGIVCYNLVSVTPVEIKK